MNVLKLALINAFAIMLIDYAKKIEKIILVVNVNLREWNAILMQIIDEKRHSFRYESDMWSKQKTRYDVIKRECKELLKILKKMRFWLYEVQFIIEIDVNTFIAQFNRIVSDLFEILIIKWLIWIRFFNFEIRHVFEKKHTVADDLSRRFKIFFDDVDEVYKENINDFINKQLNCVRVYFIAITEKFDWNIFDFEYNEKFQKIVKYLIILSVSRAMNRKELRKFKLKTLKFLMRERHFFKWVDKNMSLRRIVN